MHTLVYVCVLRGSVHVEARSQSQVSFHRSNLPWFILRQESLIVRLAGQGFACVPLPVLSLQVHVLGLGVVGTGNHTHACIAFTNPTELFPRSLNSQIFFVKCLTHQLSITLLLTNF